MKLSTLLLTSTILSLAALPVSAVEITKIDAPILPLGTVTFPNGKTMDLSVGYASGAFHMPGDPASDVYFITDRGANIACDGDAEELIGLNQDAMCAGDKDGKIFPLPEFTPSIYKMSIADDGKVTVVDTIPLKGTDGAKLNGLPNPLTVTNTENSYGVDAKEITKSANGYDSEALVRLSDGTFWIGDEYGVTISHVAADGTVLERLVPAGLEGDYAGANYPVSGKLPAITMKRKLNRGIEAISISPDEKSLYFIIQSPLANPDNDAHKSSRIARLFKFDLATQAVTGEYAYEMDKPEAFVADNKKKPAKQSDVKISEMVATGPDQLLVLERISKTTKLYHVDLAAASVTPAAFDDIATAPSLEQLKTEDLAAAGVVPVAKTVVLDTDTLDGFPSKIESVALIDANTLLLATDNDFGIAGDKTEFVKVVLDAPVSN